MPTDHRRELKKIRRFDQLIAYLRDEMGWPIARDSFDSVDDLFYDFTPEELGIDTKNAAKIQEIKRLRPLSTHQPWGVFFVKFEPKQLPVVALRRILGQVALKKRSSANSAERAAWSADDLLFVSNYGEGDTRQISFAHFSQNADKKDLPTLKVLGWNNLDTALHLDDVSGKLTQRLVWPDDEEDAAAWRKRWRSAFTLEHRQVINTSKELSVELARLARNIRDCINTVLDIETEEGPVSKLMAAFKKSLVHDLDEDGFADMYAQTIAYGLLSARVANPSGDTADDLAAAMPITNPFLKELMETFLHVGGRKGATNGGAGIDFDELGVNEVVELLDAANMEAVVRDFGDRNPQEDPVIHFYELFLKEYDAKKRMQRGVFYTPRPVVSFIVRSVDQLLRTEFGLKDGLADIATWREMSERCSGLKIPEGAAPDQAFIQILDPATGTGTFLVEVIGIIHKTMTDKWQEEGHASKKVEQLWNDYVPKHLLPRLHGYELMMAPYAIAHMKIGLKLVETGYRFGSDERSRVYLTNALEPAKDFSDTFEFAIPALAHEAKAVNSIKESQFFTVIIGNPPYANFGQLNRLPFILELLEDYKRGLDEKKINLDDDFIKFVKLAQYLIEKTGTGILGMITNNVFVDGITHRKMRQSLINFFNRMWMLDLHGSIQKREKAPDGGVDENVFDIKQGVAISIFVAVQMQKKRQLQVGDIFGERKSKYDQLLSGLEGVTEFHSITPASPMYFLCFSDDAYRNEYEDGWKVPDAMPFYNSGLQTKKDSLTVHIRRSSLNQVLDDLRDHDAEWLRETYELGPDGRDWGIKWAKDDVISSTGTVFQLQYRPFDVRYSYFTGKSKGFLAYPRRDLTECLLAENIALVTMRQLAGVPDRCQAFVTTIPMTDRSMRSTLGTPYLFPLYKIGSARDLLDVEERTPNFSTEFLAAFSKSIGCVPEEVFDTVEPQDILAYIYSILSCPGFGIRYEEYIKSDFPRVPLPHNAEFFNELSGKGNELIALHLMRSSALNTFVTTFIDSGDKEVQKVSYSDQTVWINKKQSAGFRGVPEEVWNFHLGGYQVCDKWLRERQSKGGKSPRPGHILSDNDIDYYQKIVVAIAETIRIGAEIDELIDANGGWLKAFCHGASAALYDSTADPQVLRKAAEDKAAYGE